MNDIAYCSGKNCPIRDNCRRYVFSLGVPPMFGWWEQPQYSQMTNSCPLYLGN